MQKHDVLIMAGSLARQSVSRVAGQVMAEQLNALGIPSTMLTIDRLDLPMFNPDVHLVDTSVADQYVNAARRARVLIWSAPAYHRTIGGSFKNAIDFLEITAKDKPAYLTGKAIGVISTSKGIVAAANASTELAMAAQALRAWAFPLQVPITASHKALDETGMIRDKRIVEKLELLAGEVKAYLDAPLPAIAGWG